MAGKKPRGAKKLYEARLLGCFFQTDDEKVITILQNTMDHAGRKYVEPVAQAALAGIRELNAQKVPAAVIKLIDNKVTVHSEKQYGEKASQPYDVVRLPIKTDPPGE
jgi:hypothetical protein